MPKSFKTAMSKHTTVAIVLFTTSYSGRFDTKKKKSKFSLFVKHKCPHKIPRYQQEISELLLTEYTPAIPRCRVQQDEFVKHECPLNGHFLRNVTFIFDLDLCR